MVGETHLKKKDGLWILHNGKEYCIGLTKESQDELGHITFLSLPKVGQSVKQGAGIIEVEAEKAVSEFLSPLSGVISSVNEKLDNNTDVLDSEDELDAWILSFKEVPEGQFSQL